MAQTSLSLVDSSKLLKLELFRDGEDMTSFIIRFESVARLSNCSEDSFAVRLASLLTGRAIDIYVTLTPEINANYKHLIKALLAGFNKTPDGYRQEFRSARRGENET